MLKIRTIRVSSSSVVRNDHCKIVGGSNLRPPQRNLENKTMEIRFISSLTAEDEELFAPAVLKAASALLDQLPIAYTIRIETTGAQVYQHTHVVPDRESLGLDPANGFKATAAHIFRGTAT